MLIQLVLEIAKLSLCLWASTLIAVKKFLVRHLNMDKNQVAFKTSVGLATIRGSSEHILPRPLRMLLMMIDGKTSLHRYERMLSKYSGIAQFGSVENMMEALHELGMIDFHESTNHYSIKQKTNTVKGYQPDNNNTPPLDAISPSPYSSLPPPPPPHAHTPHTRPHTATCKPIPGHKHKICCRSHRWRQKGYYYHDWGHQSAGLLGTNLECRVHKYALTSPGCIQNHLARIEGQGHQGTISTVYQTFQLAKESGRLLSYQYNE